VAEATPPAEIPADRELEMLFAPPPTQPASGNLAGLLASSLKALHVDTTFHTPIASDNDEKDECVEGMSSFSVWLDEFLRCVELSDLEAAEEEEEVVQA
jgi:hypothetical protein